MLLFGVGEPTWANACVGNNGQPGYFDYAQGYSLAANLLIKAVLGGRGLEYSIDKFVYPICFNMRHSIELRLKGICDYFIKLSVYRGRLRYFDLKGSHDIGGLWEYVTESASIIDSRFKFFVELLHQRIMDVAEIDSTGQTFRYPDDNENFKHLVDVSLINLKNLSRKFSEMEAILDYFEYMCVDLIEEYSLGTHTSKLSRSQLIYIGRLLPPKKEWGGVEFKKLVEELKLKYALSSNDFSRAIDKIKSHYGAAPALEAPKLICLDYDGMCAFFDAWFEVNDMEYLKDRAGDDEPLKLGREESIDEFFKELEDRAKVQDGLWGAIKEKVSVEWLADLKALYECHNSRYSEEYPKCYGAHKQALVNRCSDEEELRERFFDFLGMPRAIVYILKGLYLVGHKVMAEKLVAQYELEGYFGWLEDARSGKLFLEPFRLTLISFMEVLEGFYTRQD